MGFSISRGSINKPYRVVIYGVEGIGKTSLAAQFPEAVFSDTEGSTLRLDVNRFEPAPKDWSMLLEQAKYVRDNPGICKTYVVDTADWAERMCSENVCSKYNKKGIEDFGYGKGFTYVTEEFGKFLNILTEIHDKNVGVVVTAHASIRKFEQPDEMGAYDRYEMKMHKAIAAMLKEWADMVLFCNYKTVVVAQNNEMLKKKAQGGKRVMYADHTPSWDGKNRDSLPSEMPLDYSAIKHVVERYLHSEPVVKQTAPAETTLQPMPEPQVIEEATANAPAKNDEIEFYNRNDPVWQGVPDRLLQLMISAQVRPEEIMYVANEQKGYFPSGTMIKDYPGDFVEGWAIACWPQLYAAIEKNRGNTPF